MNTYNGEGNYNIVCESNVRITVRTTEEFIIMKDGAIVAPKSSTDRYAQIETKNGEHIEVFTKGKWTIVEKILPNRGEVVSSESMVEVIPENELSIMDRLRSEMLGLVSQYAEAKGMDSYEDDNDFELPDEDEPLVNTPYEYKAMIDEYPIEENTVNDPAAQSEQEQTPNKNEIETEE